MIKKIVFLSIIVSLVGMPLFSLAQSDISSTNGDESVVDNYSAIIKSEDFVEIGKKLIFDSSDSILPDIPENNFNVVWNFGDGSISRGIEVVHQYDQTGVYSVQLMIEYRDDDFVLRELSAGKDVFVYDKSALLIVDNKQRQEISSITDQARDRGVAMEVLTPTEEETNFLSDTALRELISEKSEYIKNTDLILFYTKSLRGLQSFTQYFQNLSQEEKDVVRQKFFVVITDSNLEVASHGVFQNYQIVLPDYILLTRPEAINPILNVKDYKDIDSVLIERGIESQRVDERSDKSKLYVLSRLINYFVEKGVTSESIYLILVIPFLAFIVIFFRHVIGISTFGVFTPVIITIAFYILGLKFGLLTFLFAVVSSYLVKYAFEKVEMLYLPRVALNLSFIALSFLFLMFFVLYFNLYFSLSVAVFPMLVMSTLSEKFISAKSEKGLQGAVVGVAETLVVVILSYYLMLYSNFNDLVISWPEIIIFPLLAIIILGKFTGLRVSEYFRFRTLLKDQVDEE